MDVCRDYEELFKIFNTYSIRYVVVGAQAVIFFSEPRYTKDMDVWVPPELNDPELVYKALKKFGAPLHGVSPHDFEDKKMILQIGVPPVRIDVLTHVAGTSARRVWKTRRKGYYGKEKINIIDIRELIKTKKKSGRPQDLLDLEKLTDRLKRFKRKM